MLPRDLREHGMSAKTFLGIVPVFWFGGLAIYLYRVNSALGGVASQQLMPTVMGLAAISLLLSLPILFKLLGLATKPKGKKALGSNDSAPGDFDADAAISRYLEKKAAGEANFTVPDSAAPRPTFGRKV
ncbi:hypothetical protein DAH66_07160 [Sphingomonas koreensis]|uniref:Uncharacterized protein n=2 Tax=Sphingomonas koreensis TaxID=93064 RepID=A0A430G5D8_9SPHN|nr:hypothetical protein DAH66_07160 [Sphingomonas koreensis]